jgi:septal ring factor EnvC (AmiA/AmiB activator)
MKIHTIAAKADTPTTTLVYRALMGLGMAVLTGGAALLWFGARAKAEAFIESSAAMVSLNKQADETAKRSWATAAALATEVNESKQKDSELAVNLAHIAESLNQTTAQLSQISAQQQINTTHIAVLVEKAGAVDTTLARHERALEKP